MKIKINVEVKEDGKTLRSFKGLEVNLFDTAKENLEHHGEEMLHLCFIGTSGKVNIQNRIRAYAADTDENGEFVNSDKDVEKFASEYKVTVGSGSELQSEKAAIMASKDEKEQEKLERALEMVAQYEKLAVSNVKTRKEAKKEKASG